MEVINAGVPGHSSSDALGRFITELHTFQPNYAVLSNAWNDIKYFDSREPILRVARPYVANEEVLYAPGQRLGPVRQPVFPALRSPPDSIPSLAIAGAEHRV